MQRWQRDPDGPAQLAVMLNHRYTDAGLDAGSLKGEDRATATALARAAAGAHVDVLLANIEKHEAGQGDYTGGLDTEGDVEVEHTITASVCVSLAPSGLGLVGMPATSAPNPRKISASGNMPEPPMPQKNQGCEVSEGAFMCSRYSPGAAKASRLG